jgi:hypothetical protein
VKVSKRLVRFSTWTSIAGFLSILARAHLAKKTAASGFTLCGPAVAVL